MQSKTFNKRLADHDPDAWASLYDQHARDIWRFIYSRTAGNSVVADDLAAETFLAAVESIEQFDHDRGSVSQWLFGIARRKLADHMRKRTRLRLVGELLEDPPVPKTQTDHDTERVRSVLSNMPPPQRDVLNWMYRDGMTVRQIAERINRTEKSVENLLYRARNRFRERYGSIHSTGTKS